MRLIYVTSGRHDLGIWRSVLQALLVKGHSVCECKVDISWSAGATLEKMLVEPLPDAVMLIGDRWETLLAGLAATKAGVPIIHLHGGEISLGSFDQQTRDAITKLSHLHLTAGAKQRERVISLGEHPSTVHAIGAPGTDWYWMNGEFKTPKGLDTSKGIAFLMLQPETLGAAQYEAAVSMAASKPWALLVGEPVEDPGWTEVRKAIAPLRGRPNTRFYEYLPPSLFWGLLKRATLVIGNSSCIPLECIPIGIPSKLYGQRQQGRLPPDISLLDGKAGQRAAEVISDHRFVLRKLDRFA